MKHTTNTSSPSPHGIIFGRLRSALIGALSIFVLFLSSAPALHAQPSPKTSEFQKLSDSRKERKMLIDFLIKKGKAQEAPNGTLKPVDGADADAKAAIAAENKTRLRMFELIGEQEKKSPDLVGREFHKGLQGINGKANGPAAKPKTLLSLRGSGIIGNGLAPEIAAAFLEKKGYVDSAIQRSKTSNLTTVTAKSPKSGDTVAIKIHSGYSADAFGADGLAGQRADIGMSSRLINDEEAERILVEKLGDLREDGFATPFALDGLTIIVHPLNKTEALTVKQVARAFSGHYRQWASLNGGYCDLGEIDIYARAEGTGKWASFEELVLKPNRKTLHPDVTTRYVDSADVVAGVFQNPKGVGFVGVESINPKLKVMKIKAHDRGPGHLPTPENLQNGNYPLVHQLYFYLTEKAKPLAREFVEFSTSDQGQQVIDQSRLAALKPVSERIPADIVASVTTAIQPSDELTTPLPTAPAAKKKTDVLRAVPIESQYPGEKKAYREFTEGTNRKNTPTDLLFNDSYHTELKSDSKNELTRVIKMLKTNPEKKIVVVGFSDSRGSDKMNQELSEKRAEAVADSFRESGFKNVHQAAFGESLPIESNLNREGRERNRRVEIWLAD